MRCVRCQQGASPGGRTIVILFTSCKQQVGPASTGDDGLFSPPFYLPLSRRAIQSRAAAGAVGFADDDWVQTGWVHLKGLGLVRG